MGLQITANADHDSKHEYLVTNVDGDSVNVGAGQLAMWFGSAVPTAIGYFAGQICLQAMREKGWGDPASGVNYAVTRVGDGLADTDQEVSVLPVFDDDDVVILQSGGFTKSADSNSGHIKRMMERWLERVK